MHQKVGYSPDNSYIQQLVGDAERCKMWRKKQVLQIG